LQADVDDVEIFFHASATENLNDRRQMAKGKPEACRPNQAGGGMSRV
jgi:hypothetical protein